MHVRFRHFKLPATATKKSLALVNTCTQDSAPSQINKYTYFFFFLLTWRQWAEEETGFHSLQLSGKSWSTKPSSSSTWRPASLSHPICSSPSTQPLSTLLSFPPSFPTNMPKCFLFLLCSVGWNYLQMGYGRKIDPEPRRCRRTDGKKWRFSKEAFPASKYCERHMHRGKTVQESSCSFNSFNSAGAILSSHNYTLGHMNPWFNSSCSFNSFNSARTIQ